MDHIEARYARIAAERTHHLPGPRITVEKRDEVELGIRETWIEFIEGHVGTMLTMDWAKLSTEDLHKLYQFVIWNT